MILRRSDGNSMQPRSIGKIILGVLGSVLLVPGAIGIFFFTLLVIDPEIKAADIIRYFAEPAMALGGVGLCLLIVARVIG